MRARKETSQLVDPADAKKILGDGLSVITPSKLVESVLVLLENAGCPTTVNDNVVKLIEGWELHQRMVESFTQDIAQERYFTSGCAQQEY